MLLCLSVTLLVLVGSLTAPIPHRHYGLCEQPLLSNYTLITLISSQAVGLTLIESLDANKCSEVVGNSHCIEKTCQCSAGEVRYGLWCQTLIEGQLLSKPAL